MLKISLDEAYVFDLLSILEVKIEKSSDDKKENLISTYDSLFEEIKNQIGFELLDKIVNSYEYLQLKMANEIVFNLVDRANECELAKMTADSNYNRYLIKIKLQNKFFFEKITEIKL